MKKLILAISALAVMASCKKEDPVTPVIVESSPTVNFLFQQNYDGAEVTSADFGTTQYTNARGTNHTITKLQYLVSNIVLHKSNGEEVDLGGYNFIDLADADSRYYTPTVAVPAGRYSGVTITFGFDEEDNTSGIYSDLNAASWSWPEMIGGGYHFMKFEGRFTDNTGSQTGFAYHIGTASKMENGRRIHEANHFTVRLWDFSGGFDIEEGNKTTININMNLAEWFKNPITWNLDEYHAMLMPNYTAQIMMNQNGRSVFSYGGTTVSVD